MSKKDPKSEDCEDLGEEVKGVKSCPCCGCEFVNIYHNICQEGSEANVQCDNCQLEITVWDEYNSYCAESLAIRRWNRIPKNTPKTSRKPATATRIILS